MKRELVFICVMALTVLPLFVMMPWVDLRSVIVMLLFFCHTHLLYEPYSVSNYDNSFLLILQNCQYATILHLTSPSPHSFLIFFYLR